MKKLMLTLILLSNIAFAADLLPPYALHCVSQGDPTSCTFQPNNEVNFVINNYTPVFYVGDYDLYYIYYYRGKITGRYVNAHNVNMFLEGYVYNQQLTPDITNYFWANAGNEYICYQGCGLIINVKNK